MARLEYRGKPFEVVNPKGKIFENSDGGPYKYGYPVILTREALAAVREGKL